MNCVLLGYGTVGRSVEKLLKDREDLHLQHVFVRPSKVQEPYFTDKGLEIVSSDNTDIVFECMSGLEPANTLIRAALEHGKHVISSNKAVLAANLQDYFDLAKKYGGTLQMEAAVAGGIPFLDALKKLSDAQALDGFEGIFNGTSNYILDNMQKSGLPFDEALAQAQQLGYAEANPSSDIEGNDVWYKAQIASSLAFHSPVHLQRAPLGISKISAQDVKLAKAENRIIRHLAIAKADGNKAGVLVAPAFLKPDHYLASVPANYNAQLIYAPSFGSLGYFGPGAGGDPTAQAMLFDAIDLKNGYPRLADLSRDIELDESLITEDWAVRSAADLSSLKGFQTRPEYPELAFFSSRTPELIDEVQALDPNAMIALWQK